MVQPHVKGIPLGLQSWVLRGILERKRGKAVASVLVEEIVDRGPYLVFLVQPAFDRHIIPDVRFVAEAVLGVSFGHIGYDGPDERIGEISVP